MIARLLCRRILRRYIGCGMRALWVDLRYRWASDTWTVHVEGWDGETHFRHQAGEARSQLGALRQAMERLP
jgi:hypothetical protein